MYLLQVMRHSGARGKVVVPYKMMEGSALVERDFQEKSGELLFDNDDTL